jgi:hypothetical protein
MVCMKAIDQGTHLETMTLFCRGSSYSGKQGTSNLSGLATKLHSSNRTRPDRHTLVSFSKEPIALGLSKQPYPLQYPPGLSLLLSRDRFTLAFTATALRHLPASPTPFCHSCHSSRFSWSQEQPSRVFVGLNGVVAEVSARLRETMIGYF